MSSKPFVVAPLAQLSAEGVLRLAQGIFLFFFVLLVLFILFVAPILIWRSQLRQRGYPGLRAYLRELPKTDLEKMDAAELTLKGLVLCVLGLLFPPLVVIGLAPLYYGMRKLAAVQLGIKQSPED